MIVKVKKSKYHECHLIRTETPVTIQLHEYYFMKQMLVHLNKLVTT